MSCLSLNKSETEISFNLYDFSFMKFSIDSIKEKDLDFDLNYLLFFFESQ
jgi:hypothetical protein